MIINKYNTGGGGNADYATSAGTSLNTNLLNGSTAFPSNPNTGDVVAIGAQSTKRGTKSPLPSAGVYQYDGTSWNKIEGGSGSGSSAYKIELSTNNPEDFTEEDIANLNAFFAAVIINPSIKDTAYLKIDAEIYHLSSASYTEEGGYGEFNFILSYPNWIESLIIGYGMEEFSYAETHRWEGNTLVPTIEFPQDPAYGEIANYDDGEGNVGLYQYDADNDEWVPFGGGSNNILKSVSEFPESGDKGDVIALSKPYELVSGITVDNGIYQDGDVTGKTFTIPIGDYSELPEEGYRLGAVRAIFEDYEGDNYDMTIFTDGETEDGIVFCVGDASDPSLSVNMNPENEAENNSVGGVFFKYYIDDDGDNYILDVFPSTEDGAETVAFTDVPNSILGMYQYDGSDWKEAINPKRLLPDWDANADAGRLFRISPYSPDSLEKAREADVVIDGLNEAISYDSEKGNNQILTRTNYYTYKWKQLKVDEMEPRTELPSVANLGNVYTYSNASGIGLAQVVSGHSGQTWVNFENETVPTGFTKIRVPYNDDGESHLRHFKTDPNGEGEWSLYWHPEDPNDRHWDGVPDGYSQNDGEFNAVDQWGNTMVATKVGNYIEVVFGAGVVDGDEPISTYRNTEVYTDAIIADYSEFATVDYVNNTLGNIESILQSI